jgi:hypothetical protein
MLLKNILAELQNKLSISEILPRKVLTPHAVFLGGWLTEKERKLENRGLSCQSFLETRRISEKVWYETKQYLL